MKTIHSLRDQPVIVSQDPQEETGSKKGVNDIKF